MKNLTREEVNNFANNFAKKMYWAHELNIPVIGIYLTASTVKTLNDLSKDNFEVEKAKLKPIRNRLIVKHLSQVHNLV